MRKIDFYVLLTLFLSVVGNAFGQQWNQLSMPYLQPYYANAAYAGFDRSINLALLTRNQWAGFIGSPSIRYVGAHLPIYALSAGFGSDIFASSEGAFNYRSMRISGNKIFRLFGGVLSTGARIGIHSISIDSDKIRTPDGDYENGVINHNDLLLLGQDFNGIGMGWEAGLWYRASNYQGGIALGDWPTNTFDVGKSSFTRQTTLHLFFQSFFDITENIQLQPSVSLRSSFWQSQSEINTVARINGNIFGGITLRGYSSSSIDALGILFGHKINKRYSVYYNYDIGLSGLKRSHEGSHEIMLKINFYNLPFTGQPPKIIYNPRYLE